MNARTQTRARAHARQRAHTHIHTSTHTHTHLYTHAMVYTHIKTDCFYYIILQVYEVGLYSRRHPIEIDAGTRIFASPDALIS